MITLNLRRIVKIIQNTCKCKPLLFETGKMIKKKNNNNLLVLIYFVRESACQQVVTGLKEYFNTMIGSQLLFKFERPQYSDLLREHPDKPMSQIYGAHHFLRIFGLFVCLILSSSSSSPPFIFII